MVQTDNATLWQKPAHEDRHGRDPASVLLVPAVSNSLRDFFFNALRFSHKALESSKC